MHVYENIVLCLLRVSALCAVAVFALEEETHDVTPSSKPNAIGNTLQALSAKGQQFGSITSSGEYCKLQVPYSTFAFGVPDEDLNVNFNATLSEYVTFNLCEPLNDICANGKGSAVCLHLSEDDELNVGNFPPKLSLKGNDVLIEYVGDRCNNTHNYTTLFELKCNPDEEHTFRIENEEFITNFCEFHFVFQTPRICQDKQYNCFIRKDMHTYSLNQLRNVDENYIVTINRTLSIILNVCQSLVSPQIHQGCGIDSAICLMDQSINYDKMKYTSLGNIENHSGIAYSSDGAIKITYENGQVCDTDNTKRFRSTIKFLCDMEAKKGYAEYVGGLESCDVLFVWKTAAACSEEKLVNASLATEKACGITDPIDGYAYDLAEMRQENMHYLNEHLDDYQISICTTVQSECTKGSGVCKTFSNDTTLRVSGGMANLRLLWSSEGLYLNYTDGDQCPNGQHRHTIIHFTCAKSIAADFIEKQCSTLIKYRTYKACPDLTCSKFPHTAFDSLMNSTVEHEILHNNSIYSFNICSSLHPLEYYHCKHGGAGLCKTTPNIYGQEKETGLGFPDLLPIVVDDVTTTLNFVNGSICSKLLRYSSQISLICDVNTTKSFPNLVKYESCIYYFEWRSRQSCGVVDVTMNTDCSIESHLGHRWDLEDSWGSLIHSVSSRKRNITYVIDICLTSNAVVNSSISTNETNFGKLFKGSVDYAKNMTIKLYFDNGSPCASGSRAKSIMYLICDETRNSAEPALLWEEECSVGFEWRTSLVCSPEWTAPKLSEPSILSISVIVYAVIYTMVVVLVALGLYVYYTCVKRNRVYQQNQASVVHFVNFTESE